MILNEVPNMKLFRCKSKLIMKLMVYDKHLPIFSIRNGMYHFVYNENVKKILKDIPIWATILIATEGLNKDLDKE